MKITITPELKLAFDFLEYTDKNIFLTGKAGTGKTTFLHELRKRTMKRCIVVAPTGVAAINAGGVTIHSFFQISFGPQIPDIPARQAKITEIQEDNLSGQEIRKIGRKKLAIIKALDLLIIDEISMVRADLLDAIDSVLRRFKNRNKPFGGVQLLMIGDLQQLAPVAKEADWEILRSYYLTPFFFGCLALQKTNFITIELKEIFRQKDSRFIEILNKIRDNSADRDTIDELNKHCQPGFSKEADEGYIILTTHNANAQKINEDRLNKLSSESYLFTATIEGDFPEYSFPTEPELVLKEGAQVMFVKNDLSPDKLFYNGKIGKIKEISDEIIFVECPGEEIPIPVQTLEWDNMKYSINETTAVIEESVIGKFIQYPLKLAWAITIHKSQGLTFEKAVIDANMAFAHGQIYVALSRCRSLEGIVLETPLSGRGLSGDIRIAEFNREAGKNAPDEKILQQSKNKYFRLLLFELFDFTFLQKQLNYFEKLLKENKTGLIVNQREIVMQIGFRFSNDVSNVATRFENQLLALLQNTEDIETDEILKDRIIKACIYFEAKLKSIVSEVIENFTVESDNKTILKQINELKYRIEDNIKLKTICLNACKEGFSVKKYLEARALSVINNPVEKEKTGKKVKIKTEISDSAIAHPKLFIRLKEWRKIIASNSNIATFMVFSQKTLIDITNSLPVTYKTLKKIKGIGAKKLDKYGDELLAIIRDYCVQNQIDISEQIKHSEPEKENSMEKTYSLSMKLKTAEEIANERKLAISTVEGHLASLVYLGRINITQLVLPYKLEIISNYFIESNDLKLAPAKQKLGEDISYAELRYVLNYLLYSGKLKTN